jgi:hypothetical protein
VGQVTDGKSAYPLQRQYRAWLRSTPSENDTERRAFFTHGLIVLDTNVLLNLYDYTPSARNQVFEALEQVKDNMWLPHQVGLEYVRGRHRVVDSRNKDLKDAQKVLRRKFDDARNAVAQASKQLQQLLEHYARDTMDRDAIAKKINEESTEALLNPWYKELSSQIKKLQEQHDIDLSSVAIDDPVLARLASIFGDRIAKPTHPDLVQKRVDEASSYRFPNKIPPGYSDANKDTPLQSAGDYLLWAELLDRTTAIGAKRVLLVSADTKDDWYEPAEPGRSSRPWPMLVDELWQRAGADLRIETPKDFYRGVGKYLHANITQKTYAEIDRAVESRTMRRASAAFSHIDDLERRNAYLDFLGDDSISYEQLSERKKAYARMFFFSVWPDGGDFSSYQDGLDSLRQDSSFRRAIRQRIERTATRPVIPLLGPSPLDGAPLFVHASYSRQEMLAALDMCAINGPFPFYFREGVKWCEAYQADVLFVTLEKGLTVDEEESYPGLSQADFAIDRSLFRWQSQRSISATSATGQRYQCHGDMGTHILIFARRYKTSAEGTAQAMTLLGPADYVEHEGERPMNITWRLHHDMPTEIVGN